MQLQYPMHAFWEALSLHCWAHLPGARAAPPTRTKAQLARFWTSGLGSVPNFSEQAAAAPWLLACSRHLLKDWRAALQPLSLWHLRYSAPQLAPKHAPQALVPRAAQARASLFASIACSAPSNSAERRSFHRPMPRPREDVSPATNQSLQCGSEP